MGFVQGAEFELNKDRRHFAGRNKHQYGQMSDDRECWPLWTHSWVYPFSLHKFIQEGLETSTLKGPQRFKNWKSEHQHIWKSVILCVFFFCFFEHSFHSYHEDPTKQSGHEFTQQSSAQTGDMNEGSLRKMTQRDEFIRTWLENTVHAHF